MQTFVIHLRHISGAKNTVADWMSGHIMHLWYHEDYSTIPDNECDISCLLLMCICEQEDEMYALGDAVGDVPTVDDKDMEGGVITITPTPIPLQDYRDYIADRETGAMRIWTPKEMFEHVHGGRNLHKGSRRTYLDLCERFPGHKIPRDRIEEWIAECGVCQKDRLGMKDYIEPVVRHIKPTHARSRVSIDNLSVSPEGRHGETHLQVIVDGFSKYVYVRPSAVYNAESIATTLFIYFTTFGVFDELWSDPGSDLMSDVVKQLNKWLGIKHVVSLVERHESNGVEGSNKQILRHLRTIVHDKRITKDWSEPYVLCLVLFVINDEVNSETGVRPFDARFGWIDSPYLKLTENALPEEITHEWIKQLDDKLRTVRSISSEYQAKLVKERLEQTPEKRRNVYHPGELVLLQRDPSQHLPTKLSMHFTGPWEVIKHESNAVEIRHIATHEIKNVHITRLKMYHGDRAAGYETALRDADQYVVIEILAWRGTVTERSCMWFKVYYADGDILWQEWSRESQQRIPTSYTERSLCIFDGSREGCSYQATY